MKVTVVPIIDQLSQPSGPLSKLMNARLKRLAYELQSAHLQELEKVDPRYEDIVIYITYDKKYNVLWRIVNDVSEYAEEFVAKKCAMLNYLLWKGASLYNQGRK